MNRTEKVMRPLTWFIAVLAAVFLTACGGGGGDATPAGVVSSAKAITAYSLSGVAGTINETAKTIAVVMPSGTNVTALVASFTTTAASLKVGGIVATPQVSGVTPNNFSAPVTYTATAADGSTVAYTVAVTVASVTAKATTAFSLSGIPGVINEAGKTITVTLPNGSNVTALVATFNSTGQSVKVGATPQVSGVTPNNFTAPVTYTVTAADASTATYTVAVTVAPAAAKAITALSLAGVGGVVNEAAKTIVVTMPAGTGVTALVASFTTTGQSVKVGTTTQVSGTTANNFTAPVAYIVTAADASSATYNVTVNLAPTSAKAATTYSLGGVAGTINEAAKTITVALPAGSDLTAQIATFATTGASVKVGATTQISGATANNFTVSPVAYTVTAADGSVATYNVTVSLAGAGPAPVSLGTAGNFVILTKAGITDVPASAITGNIGTSPISGAFIGVPCGEVTGTIYSVDAAGPACRVTDDTLLTTAVSNMETAYTDAAGRPAGVGPNLNIGAGTVANQTLAPGTYTWGTNVSITTDLTLNGAANDVWIFQINGTLDLAATKQVLLQGGALPKNIFWQVTGTVTLGTGSHFEGVILAQTNIAMLTGASTNGRLLAQTAATLQANPVVQPAP